MSLDLITQDIYATKPQFNSVLSDADINFEREASFAVQVLQGNSYAVSVAMRNRQSVVDAVVNLAAIGLSLNPAKKQAYLVPRKSGIVLEISYMGLVELAVSSGSVRWVQAEVVCQQDAFTLNGYDKPPTHSFNPFGERGPVVGAYCVAKTADGDYLTTAMSIADIHAIRDRSEAWKNGQKGPWATDHDEMVKKTVVKRASKLWPKTDRLDAAVHHLNTEAGEGLVLEAKPVQTGFDLDSAIALVEAAQTRAELDDIFKVEGAKALAAKDAAAYRALGAACKARDAAIKATDVQPKEEAHA